tara:strand:- start:5552 stop:6211 length:660 start_codon:yes stop_codon:yes gene_type:complete
MLRNCLLGCPEEFTNPNRKNHFKLFEDWEKSVGPDKAQKMFKDWLHTHKSARGILGIKALTNYIPATERMIGAPDKIIFLVRRDKHRQAISLLRARTTGKWGVATSVIAGDYVRHQNHHDEQNQLNEVFRNILNQEQRCLEHILVHRNNGVPIYILSYEDLQADTVGQINSISQFLGVDEVHNMVQTTRTVQRDELTEQMLEDWTDKPEATLPSTIKQF